MKLIPSLRQTSCQWRALVAVLALAMPAFFLTGTVNSAPPQMGGGMQKPCDCAAHQHGRMHHRGSLESRWLLTPQAQEKLILTPDQVNRIKKIDYEAQKAGIGLDAQIRLARLDFKRLMQTERPDRQKVLAQADTLAKITAEKRKLVLTHRLDVRDVLTDDQLKKIKEFRAEHRQAMQGRPGRSWRRQGGPGWFHSGAQQPGPGPAPEPEPAK